jgi:hypothetical protein
MNSSTGGPHILLFERDQQLAALLISELQLAGYECHTARTAVEVFDTISRRPVRMVLVNLAQAAAARREFWVQLDSQRRGRGIQVMTFRCTNLASYGPHDPEDRSQSTMVDLEVDGMFGVMKLVDAIRERVPTAASTANTMSRIPRVATPPPTTTTTPSNSYVAPQRSAPSSQQASITTNNPIISGNGTVYRSAPDNGTPRVSTRVNSTPPPPVNTPNPPVTAAQQISPMRANPSLSPGTAGTGQPSYTEKIRAVLYPDQRNWSPPANSNYATTPGPVQDTQNITYNTANTASYNPTPTDSPMLQRLANGQVTADGQKESGLAQLSRLVQERRTSALEELNNAIYTSQETTAPAGLRPMPSDTVTEQASPNPGFTNYTRPVSTGESISTQPLRASPIQDIPAERPSNGLPASEVSRRPDVLSRTNYGQQLQQSSPTAASPLASIATPMPAASAPAPASTASVTPSPAPPPVKPAPPVPAEKEEPVAIEHDLRQQEISSVSVTEKPFESGKENGNHAAQADREPIYEAPEKLSDAQLDSTTAPNNALLLDIVQSLPPMPALPPQSSAMQPQVLSGRATRSLGSVLIEGHLVPQSRLEVAQNIQRMLRGVDLNYQLGEILLMFKLLTPDQLLAASLVSYGLITTTQVSALGRIRQELHSIGLEYDLENLLILFRILTPEQLREVKTDWQG